MSVVCAKCGTEFVRLGWTKFPTQVMCPECLRLRRVADRKRWYRSAKGRVNYQLTVKTGTCSDCGKTGITTRATRCSVCSKTQTGQHAHSWRGGRIRSNQYGYISLFDRSHHRANKNGYVMEHIVVWERANNKELPAGWVIHHLNGVKDDNRPTNLVALSSQKHFGVLAAKAKRIQELEALLKQQGQLV
ncbi:hypothetical protein LCGC14_2921720 [marine sediment metagenome]|uniref:HNH nuclease domain-containing protein n=1 Tax=marine sediment metagenome TaxID=412755 RepID=A0A0F8XNV7_9ZZZZ